MPKTLPLPRFVETAKFVEFVTKIAIFFAFFTIYPNKSFVPDLVGLLELFFGIPAGRVLFYQTWIFKIG